MFKDLKKEWVLKQFDKVFFIWGIILIALAGFYGTFVWLDILGRAEFLRILVPLHLGYCFQLGIQMIVGDKSSKETIRMAFVLFAPLTLIFAAAATFNIFAIITMTIITIPLARYTHFLWECLPWEGLGNAHTTPA